MSTLPDLARSHAQLHDVVNRNSATCASRHKQVQDELALYRNLNEADKDRIYNNDKIVTTKRVDFSSTSADAGKTDSARASATSATWNRCSSHWFAAQPCVVGRGFATAAEGFKKQVNLVDVVDENDDDEVVEGKFLIEARPANVKITELTELPHIFPIFF